MYYQNSRPAVDGTREYIPPKYFGAHRRQGKPYDYLSIGVVTFELICGHSPFWTEDDENDPDKLSNFQEIYTKRKRDVEYEMPQHVSQDAQDFIRQSLDKDPNQRMNVKEGLRHSWIAQQGSEQDLGGLMRSIRLRLDRFNLGSPTLQAMINQ